MILISISNNHSSAEFDRKKGILRGCCEVLISYVCVIFQLGNQRKSQSSLRLSRVLQYFVEKEKKIQVIKT